MCTLAFRSVSALLFIVLATIDLIAQSYSGGAGTVGDPYQVADKTDLKYLSEHSADWDNSYIQTADIYYSS